MGTFPQLLFLPCIPRCCAVFSTLIARILSPSLFPLRRWLWAFSRCTGGIKKAHTAAVEPGFVILLPNSYFDALKNETLFYL